MAVAIAADVVPVLPGHGGPVLPVPGLRPVARHVHPGASAHVRICNQENIIIDQ